MGAAESIARADLLALVAAGDAGAVRAVLQRYGSLVWSMARRLVPSEADDAVQEIFVELWKSAHRFDPASGSETAFIATIARRRLIDRRRRIVRRAETPASENVRILPDGGVGPETSAEAKIAARALESLRPEQRDVVLMATCQGLSHDEIATKTGLPLGTVKAHARRGLARIRAALLGVEEGQVR
ncbi:MAG TPA: sigma-70 family RNA polymerase sigma factor [Polyangiaceae bacterium]